MQMVKKAILFLVVAWAGLIIFMPKQQLYFSLEKVLQEQDIEINEANLSETLLGLNIQGLTVYAKGIKIAKIKEVSAMTLLFYTNVEAEEITVDGAFKSMVPSKIDHVLLSHSILAPSKIKLEANGDFGTASGEILLGERKIHIDLNSTKNLGALGSMFKQGKEGLYYESTY